ncbi:MAG: hypothetical protein ACOY3L_04385 [Pseudomonadota bacterium]
MQRAFIISLLLALAAVVAQPAAAERLKLSGSEIKELLSNKTAYGYRGNVPYRIYFAADGTMIDEEQNGQTRTGRWVAKQTQHCMTWLDGAENCMALYRDRQQIIWVDPVTGSMDLAQLKDGKDLSW